MAGNTSYQTLPFANNIFQQSWCSSPTLSPANLFWKNGNNFNNTIQMNNARIDAASKTAKGIVPISGCQRWDDTYLAAMPQVSGEPSYITSDRASIVASGEQAAFTAWANWLNAHKSMFMVNADGTVNPNGHISPLQPLSSVDSPSNIGTTYGDLFAKLWSETSAICGAYGIVLSDYSDSQPIGPSYSTGFNQEIVSTFANIIGGIIPGNTVPQWSSFIIQNYFNKWTDYLCSGYARFFGSLAVNIAASCNTSSLVIDQCGLSPSQRRLYGVDARIIADKMSPDNIICIWDNQTFRTERSGQPMIWSLGGAVISAAREPNIRNGANLECDTPSFWQAIAKFYPGLSSTDQRERGLKDIKRNWLENAFSHICDRSGNVRRALCFMSRDYWDSGNLDSTLTNIIQSIIPTRPYGYAVYYSKNCEANAEVLVGNSKNMNNCYMTPDKLVSFKQAGNPVGYYVSDLGITSMTKNSYPAAWIVLDGTLNNTETTALKRIAPIISPSLAKTWAKAPLKFSSGVTGFGFYDQNNRLIIIATNTTDSDVNAIITLNPLPANVTSAISLFDGSVVDLTKTVKISRWDTLVLAIS
jgi:hypothetical protein